MEKQQITFKGLSTKLTEMETVSETVVNWGVFLIFQQNLCRPEESGRVYLKW